MPVVPITDLNQEGLAPYTALTERQARADGILIAESEMVIRMALGCGLTPLSFLMEARHARGKAASLIADFPGIPVYTGDEEILKALTGYSLTRGILCALRRPAPRPWRSLMSGSRFVLLCGLTDGANVGTLFRSAAALGADALFLSPDCCDPLTRKAVRTSMGAVFPLPWARVGQEDWPDVYFSAFRQAGIATAAMTLSEGSVSLKGLDAPSRIMAVLGPEGPGLPRDIQEKCSLKVHIPMYSGIDSLNVAAAGAIAFWELFR